MPGDPRINRAGRPRRVLSDAYKQVLESPLPFDPKELRNHIETMIKNSATGAEVAAVLMYANLFKGNAVAVSAATEIRKATEGDRITVGDVKAEALKRMAELGLTEQDVWERDSILAEYLASIGAIGDRPAPPDPAGAIDQPGEPGQGAPPA